MCSEARRRKREASELCLVGRRSTGSKRDEGSCPHCGGQHTGSSYRARWWSGKVRFVAPLPLLSPSLLGAEPQKESLIPDVDIHKESNLMNFELTQGGWRAEARGSVWINLSSMVLLSEDTSCLSPHLIGREQRRLQLRALRLDYL